MSGYDWSQVGNNIHGDMESLDNDNHYQYFNDERHGVLSRHILGHIVSRDVHNLLENLDGDDHAHYINATRHNRERHPPSVVPEFSMVVSGGPNSEPVFAMDGDIIVTEVM